MSSADAVAAGNGMIVLPEFRRHVHTETDCGTHEGWNDCALTMCTWAGLFEWAQDEACAKAER